MTKRCAASVARTPKPTSLQTAMFWGSAYGLTVTWLNSARVSRHVLANASIHTCTDAQKAKSSFPSPQGGSEKSDGRIKNADLTSVFVFKNSTNER